MRNHKTKHRIRFREIRQTDWQDIHAYASLDITCRYQPWGPNTEDETLAFMSQVIKDSNKNPRTRFSFAIIEETADQLIGVAELNVKDFSNGEGEIGYVVHPDYWGQGYATEAGELLLNLGYSVLKLHRIYATCHPENKGSAKVLEKLGMIKEGILRENIKMGDGYRSSLLYSMLEQEWKDAYGEGLT